MNCKQIEEKFKDRKPRKIGKYKRSSVVIPLYEEEGITYIIFERRSLKLKHQPGDICLPGGKIEPGENPKEAAVRELMEELCVKESDIEIIGQMDYLVTPFSLIMYPYVGRLKSLTEDFNRDEVDSMIKIPLEFFINNTPLIHEDELKVERGEEFPFHLIRGGKEYNFSKIKYATHFYKYGDVVVWGHTARIIYEFIKIIKGDK
ncbi:NUDIX hydrolase [Clostridium paridis]|uniref:CoA pyrophosphatase n=1 Tax=Clostridium paridis TaxID=2803863 RepID=A0A937FH17_9CLOT|nr:CoA pyrophosphatase [Clostridium paridis]MBL4932117.1 CoA pyrophosphatase [Clostridium paridis]